VGNSNLGKTWKQKLTNSWLAWLLKKQINKARLPFVVARFNINQSSAVKKLIVLYYSLGV